VTALDRRLLCCCTAQPDGRCEIPADGEDMRCRVCRRGCTGAAYLAAEDARFHLIGGDLDGALALLDPAYGEVPA
jgi:hypothetical protein